MGLDDGLMKDLDVLVKDLGERCVLGWFGVIWRCLELKGHVRGEENEAERGIYMFGNRA